MTPRPSHINRALHIQRTLGTRNAAAFLRNRRWSIEAALHILTRRARMAP